MVKQVVIHHEDDLDGDPAAETVTFALDDNKYVTAPSPANTGKLRQALHPYAAATRKTARRSGKD